VRASLAVALLLVALMAGCGGSGHTLRDAQLSDVVLQPADLPGAFTQFDVGRQARLDRVAGPRYDATRYGRESGWKARYNRPGTAQTKGPLVVESRVDLFHDSKGAQTDLEAYRVQFQETPASRIVAVPKIGEGSVAAEQMRAGTPPVRFVTVAWRDGNVTASVAVNGFAAHTTLADAVALARKQEKRIADALGRG